MYFIVVLLFRLVIKVVNRSELTGKLFVKICSKNSLEFVTEGVKSSKKNKLPRSKTPGKQNSSGVKLPEFSSPRE